MIDRLFVYDQIEGISFMITEKADRASTFSALWSVVSLVDDGAIGNESHSRRSAGF
jgi:hypothetical protein